MRDFLLRLFQFGGGPEIILFSIWHIMYIVIIIGGTIGMAFALKSRSEKVKTTVLNIIAVTLLVTYIADFFIMPLNRFNGDETRQLIDIDKLPFHICTFMGIMVAFAQFNRKAKNSSSFREVVGCLAIVSSLMYITYPGSALGEIGTFSYKVVQTFLYHGLLLAWGVLSLTTGAIMLKFKNIWKQFIGILIIMLWATLGNYAYGDYNWFFLKESIFPFIPDSLMPLAVLFAVFGMCAIVYSIDLGVRKLIEKRQKEQNVKPKKSSD